MFVQKWQLLVRAKAAAPLKPEMARRYVEDFKGGRTPAWAERCRFWVDTQLSTR